MRITLILLLFLAVGCGSSSAPDETSDAPLLGESSPIMRLDDSMSIVGFSRPNSGEFTTEQATKLLSGFLERSVPVLPTNKAITQWKSPTQGIRIHVNADDTVTIVNYFGDTVVGLNSVNDALDSTGTYGNERSVLLTSDKGGWKTPTKQKVVSLLFQPSVQVYIVVDGT